MAPEERKKMWVHHSIVVVLREIVDGEPCGFECTVGQDSAFLCLVEPHLGDARVNMLLKMFQIFLFGR